MILLLIIVFLVIGSFLNVCIYRIPRSESIVFPPSHCINCGNNLKPVDLIPVLSYIFLQGRCRFCGERISAGYPVVEGLNAILYLFLYYKFGLSFEFIGFSVLTSLLIVISIIDLKHKIVPDKVVLFTLISGIAFNIYPFDLYGLFNGILGFLTGGGIFLLIAIISNGAMGGGDIKLIGALGFWFGFKHILLVTLLSFIIGAITCVFLLILHIKNRKDYIPFVPFISIASYLVIVFGDQILQFYLRIFFI